MHHQSDDRERRPDSVADAARAPEQFALADLVDAPTLKSMFEDFYAVTNIPISLIDTDGVLIAGAGWQEACTRFHRVHPETCAHCLASDTVLTASIAPGEVKLYRCENGMWDAATPVMVGDDRVGNLFTGQFFFDDEAPDVAFFREQARRYGFDERDYLAAIEAAPRLPRIAVDTGLRFLTKLSNMISQLSFSNARRELAEARLQRALDVQEAHTKEVTAEWGVLRAIMENTRTHLAYLDPEFNFVMVNSTYARGSGHAEEELLGRNHFDLFPGDENRAIFERARATGESVEFHARPYEFPDQPWRGATYWDWSLTPVNGRDGQLQGFALSLTDVTSAVRQRVFSDAINRLNDVIHSNFDSEWILARSVPELAKATRCEFVGVALSLAEDRWRLEEGSGVRREALGQTFGTDDLGGLAEAIASERPLVTTEIRGLLADIELHTLLAVPLIIPDQHLGLLLYGHTSGPGEFDEQVVDFAGKAAASLSLALANSRLFHEVRHTGLVSATLAKVNEILLSAITLHDVLARLVGEVSEVAGADTSLVLRVHGSQFAIAHVRNMAEEWVGQVRDADFFPAFALAAESGTPVLIEDNWNDPRTNKEFVVPAGLRAFQLLPLTTAGSVTHVLALAYDSPRTFGEDDYRSAERMAMAMSVALNNARLYENEHRIADRLQEALLALPDEIPDLEFAYAYHSATEAARVGGDLYDIFEIDVDRVGVTIGDVAGKGLDAAVLTSIAKNTVRAHASEKGKQPARILALANDVVYRATPPDSFVTLFFGILNRRDGTLVYANAGHPPGLIIGDDGSITQLRPTGPLLGAFERAQFEEASATLALGETLLLHTDGLIEARRDSTFYGEARFFESLREAGTLGAGEMVEHILTDALAFSHNRLTDDLAVVALRRADRESESGD